MKKANRLPDLLTQEEIDRKLSSFHLKTESPSWEEQLVAFCKTWYDYYQEQPVHAVFMAISFAALLVAVIIGASWIAPITDPSRF